MEINEILNKGTKSEKGLTVDIGNVRILNVILPSTEQAQVKYQLIANKTLKRCGIRNKISYYPIPPEIARKKEMVPFYFFCLAKGREGKKLSKQVSCAVDRSYLNENSCN